MSTLSSFTSIEELNVYLKTLSQKARTAIGCNDFTMAQGIIEQVLAIVPQHIVALADLAFVKSKLNKHSEAYQHLLDAIKYGGDRITSDIYDTLVGVCVPLNKFEEAIYYAKISINIKKAQASNRAVYTIPNTQPPGLSDNPKCNIISYSLFGGNPRYCETAILNTQLAKEIYPQWTCRFYVDHSVPTHVLERLTEAGAEIVFVSEEQQKVSGLFWRFAVAEDPNVQCFIIRDADSLLSYKEKAAVDEWLASGKWFHVMRDSIGHCELILAGMWGGYSGIFSNIFQKIQTLLAEVDNHTNLIDQVFLRYHIFPTVIQSAMVHDSRHLDSNTHPFPNYKISDVERIPYFHIGMVDMGALPLSLTVEDQNAKRVRWWLTDKEKRVICSYESDVPASRTIALNLPYFYAQKVENGEYHLVNQTIS